MTSTVATPSRTQALFGFDFINDTEFAATVDRILGTQPVDDRLPLVVTPNVDDLVRLSEPRHAELATAARQARYVLPDGQPIVWSSHLLGRPLDARLPGASLFPELWARIVRDARPTLVVAASTEVADGLGREHPTLRAVVPPMFDADDDAALGLLVRDCLAVIDEVRPELVVVGIGFPKQQRLALALIDELQRDGRQPPIFLLLGGALDMYLGRVPRAPRWMQHSGLEWFYRFLREPRRLFRRYFVTDLRFVSLFLVEVRAAVSRNSRIEVS